MLKFPWKYSRRVKNPSDLLRGPITEGLLVHCLSIKRRHKNDTKANSPAGHRSHCHHRWTNNSQPHFPHHYQSNLFCQRSETGKTQKPNHLCLPNFFFSLFFSFASLFASEFDFIGGFFVQRKVVLPCGVCRGKRVL